MKRTHLWIIAAVLTVGSIYILFFHSPGARSELVERGVRGYGSVHSKDTRPGPNGETQYMVTFIYQDSMNKNHMVTQQVYSSGQWDSFKPGQDVHVVYLPNDPDKASIEGLAAQQSSALRFLAWTALIAGLIVGYLAWKAPKEPKKPKDKGPIITHR
jgi:hypothetical protein